MKLLYIMTKSDMKHHMFMWVKVQGENIIRVEITQKELKHKSPMAIKFIDPL